MKETRELIQFCSLPNGSFIYGAFHTCDHVLQLHVEYLVSVHIFAIASSESLANLFEEPKFNLPG